MHFMRCTALAATVTLACMNTADAAFSACTLANNSLAATSDPVDFVRFALRADGRPLLAFSTDVHNASSLYLYDCANPTCRSGHVVYLDTSSNYYGAPGIALRGDGRPLVVGSYLGGVRLYDCLDTACSDFGVHTIRENGSAIFSDLPTVLQANGNPALLYVDGVLGLRPGQLVVHFCSDSTCDAAGTEQVLATPPPDYSAFSELSFALDSAGIPAATYLTSEGASNLYTYDIARCTDAACAGETDTQISAPVGDSTSTRSALALRSDGRPLAMDNQANNIAWLDCSVSACTSSTDRALPSAAVGQPLGLKLMSADRPAFALFSTDSAAAFACADALCSSGQLLQTPTSSANILDGDFALDAGVAPALVWIDFDTRTLAVAGCDGDVLFIDGFD